jgi:uncharacterized protein (DUF2147 family)
MGTVSRAFVSSALLSAVLSVVASTSLLAQASRPTAAGLWEKDSESGRPDAWFRIIQCDGRYEGKIAKIFPKPGENPSRWRCTKCEGGQRDAPVVGITFIKDMERDGLTYEDGTILDPRDGSRYSAVMQLSPDGQRLTVRGYLGIPLLGRSEVWHRIADNQQSDKSESCS